MKASKICKIQFSPHFVVEMCIVTDLVCLTQQIFSLSFLIDHSGMCLIYKSMKPKSHCYHFPIFCLDNI